MKYITKEKYEELCLKDKYFKHRWNYYNCAIEYAKQINPETCLELGPYKLPICIGSDVMDVRENVKGAKYIWDATKTPWPIEDKAYDLFVGLQVFEHLYEDYDNCKGGAQAKAFNEVKRISKNAIISLPWKWGNKKNCSHYGINEKTIENWFKIEPKKMEIVKDNSLRAVLLFEF